ncbi:radical SAM protein [Lentibacillus cibarius]|uniref:Radical SAM protein n=1 Tax=Lentibacillus cibarius TaxID=2583219 RepID=A0A549YGB6_9BACI|nr:radical SAM protein [Lentibacillus cibarius]TRM10923.1 radical SAM protein [Lentibacillus cibarius]
MLRKVTKENITSIANESFRNYAQLFTNIEEDTLETIHSFGLPLERRQNPDEKQERLATLEAKQAILRNNNKSVYVNQISSACEACKTGTGSYTSFISLNCHRDCYFCFNKNQDDYAFYLNHKKDVNEELSYLIDSGLELKHLALTGGEPLLFKEDTVNFFRLAQQITPNTFTRLYTAGDLLTETLLQQLKEAGLDEIRISIKMEDSLKRRQRVLEKIKLSKQYIPYVLVEMPVIPGTQEEMKELLVALDEIGIFGINLLEFCFPLVNATSFNDKGYRLKNPPYEIYYNYWYAGGLAVAESEALCLDLVEFALDQSLSLGVHYCSLENKFTGQIYQQNHDQAMDHTYHFSSKDYFYKTVKAFGKDREIVKQHLEAIGVPFTLDDELDFIQFPVSAIHALKIDDVELAVVSNVVESRMNGDVVREVSVDWTTPLLFEAQDIN